MALSRTFLTIHEFESLAEGEAGERQELIDGVVHVTPVPILPHEDVVAALMQIVGAYIRMHGLGKAYTATTGVKLSETTLVKPDFSYVSRGRLHICSRRFVEGAPDLTVEVLSPSTRRDDLVLKRHLYERHGVAEYWIVDVDARSVQVLSLQDGCFVPLPGEQTGVIPSRVLPELRLTLEDLFEDVMGYADLTTMGEEG